MIDRNTINRINNATDIVDVVKEFVTLRKAGVNYKGLCPFHDEKTPSFVVSPSKQLFKCFSCGKGGGAVHFIMEHEQMTYPEAMKWLGRKYGIEVQERELTPEERLAAGERESMFVLNEWARDYFTDTLRNSADGVAVGMAYFRQRGFRDDIIRKFQLGYSPANRDALARAALAKGFREEYLLKTGLCYRTDEGRLLDRYHGRVIFPVHTVSGKVVAFGGRILGADKKLAKYVNSPESEIYHKSNELYGLYLAKHAIVKLNRCFLVEGYTDVISMHQSGVENVVASSGTSLTTGQIRLLHRFTQNITVLYDGDSAGIKASLRGIDMLLAEGMNIKVLLLPDGEDPDSFARSHNAAAFQEYIDAHQVDFIRFKTDLLLKDCGNDPVKRAGLVQDIVRSIAAIPDAIVRQMYVRECATMMGVSESLIVSEIAKIRREKRVERDKREERGERRGEGVLNGEEGGEQREESGEMAVEGGGLSSLPQAPALAETRARTMLREEELLVTLIVRYGVLPVYKPEQLEEDEENVNVTEFVAGELANDELTLRSPLLQRILAEAVEHAREPDFNPTAYFINHPDADVSRWAANMAEDRYQLSRYHYKNQKLVEDKDRLYELAPRLVNDYKHTIVREQMKALLKELGSPEVVAAPERYKALMEEYMGLSEVERQFAQVLGDRVVSPK